MLPHKDDPLASETGGYANGVFRPEGVSAEREGGSASLLRNLGLQSKRQKDYELAKTQFAEGETIFEQAKTLQGKERTEAFRAASAMFEKAADNWQMSDLEQDSLLMAGECRFFAEDYYQAEQIYSKLVKEYPRNRYMDHVDSRKFEIGDFWLKVDSEDHQPFVVVNFSDPQKPWNDTGGHGKRVLEELRINNPTGKVGDDATMRLATQHFVNGEFEEAAQFFAELRTIYPDSVHQFDAQFLEVQSLLASYQGYQYSSVPLQDAQKRVKQLVRQFPVESQEKQAEINQAYAAIRFAMAERIWHQAQYRMSRSENASARFHLKRIVADYADTPFREQASEALTSLQGAPDDPEQQFKFLAYVFGETTDDRPWMQNK